MRLYVGNLPYSINDDTLRSLFESYGQVESARVISDRDTGASKGFGFVEMANADAQKAIEGLNGRDYNGRALRIDEARPQEARSGGGGGGGRGGYGGGGGRNRY
jgi:RNA recognition motif-containing protein